MRKITKLAFVAASVSMLFASCQKDSMISEGVADLQRPIEVNPVTGFEGTRSAIYGSTMPFDRNLVISSVYNKGTDRGVVGTDVADYRNYFQGVTFAYNASKKTWSSDDNPVYWPLTGTLDFLAYSTTDNLTPTWGSGKWTEGVELRNFTNNDISDDLLYGVAQNSSPSTTAVPIEFKHAKALIVFTAKASFDEAIEIKSIELENVQPVTPSTTVTLPNPDGTGELTWESLGSAADQSLPGVTDINRYTVPRTKIDVTKKSGYLGIGGEGIMLAPQAMTTIKVTFVQKYKGGTAIGDEITETFTYDCKLGLATEDQNWEEGKRYIYELDFRVNEINVVASVDPWQDAFGENNPYVIDIPEVAICDVPEEGTNKLKVMIFSNTKFIFDNGNNDVKVYTTNDYAYDPNGIVKNVNETFQIDLVNNKRAKFYVSEDGKVEVTISYENLVIDKVFDTEKFDVKYYVTFKARNDTYVNDWEQQITVRSGTNIVEGTFDLPTREGYVIEGWYKTSDLTGNKWDFDKDKVTKALTLYANWVAVTP